MVVQITEANISLEWVCYAVLVEGQACHIVLTLYTLGLYDDEERVCFLILRKNRDIFKPACFGGGWSLPDFMMALSLGMRGSDF